MPDPNQLPPAGDRSPPQRRDDPAPGRAPSAALGGREIELKLLVDPADMARVRRHPLVRALRKGRAQTRDLDSVYYDTRNHALRKAGLALRVRTVGRHRFQQVKVEGDGPGLTDRREWEDRLAGPEPDPRLAFGTPAAGLLNGLSATDLAPVFATRFRRTTTRLEDPSFALDLALDHGEITAAGRSLTISEMELEVVDGAPMRIVEIARALAETIPMRLGVQSKAARGWMLAEGVAAKPKRAGRPAVRSDAGLAAAFRDMVNDCLHHLLANQEPVLEGTPVESIHQSRVAIRRLRSVVTTFRPCLPSPETAALLDRVKAAEAAFACVRDLDVLLAETLLPARNAAGGDLHGLPRLIDLARAARAVAADEARATIRAPGWTVLMLDLLVWAHTTPVADPRGADDLAGFARQVLDRRIRRVARGAAAFDTLSVPDRHALRIHVKKLRYAAEFFQTLMAPKRASKALAAMRSVQEHLGALNDAAVARATVAGLIGPKPDPELAEAAGFVAGWRSGGLPGHMAAAGDALRDLATRLGDLRPQP